MTTEAKEIVPQAAQTLDQVLVEAINKTGGAVGEAVDFTLSQAPELVEQLFYWKVIESLVNCSFGILCFFTVYVMYRIVRAAPMPESYGERNIIWWDKNEMHPGTSIFGGILVVSLIVSGFILLNLTWLKILVAPKLYLLEYAASLIK